MRAHQLLTALGLVIVLGIFTRADAQNPYGNPYSAPNWLTRPTISPWLQLYRRDGIPDVPNYHQFVRPRQQMQRYLLQQNQQLQRQQLQLRQIERQQAAMQQTQSQMLAPQQSPNYRAPTGIGSSYMTHGSYFGGSHKGYFGIGR